MSVNSPEVEKLNLELLQLQLMNKSCMRTVIDTVEKYRQTCDSQRSATDNHNLTLQSYLYEAGYYEK